MTADEATKKMQRDAIELADMYTCIAGLPTYTHLLRQLEKLTTAVEQHIAHMHEHGYAPTQPDQHPH